MCDGSIDSDILCVAATVEGERDEASDTGSGRSRSSTRSGVLPFAKKEMGPAQARFDGHIGDAHLLGNLLIRLSVPDAQLEHGTERWRQLSNSPSQKLLLLSMNQSTLRVERAILQNRTQRQPGFFSGRLGAEDSIVPPRGPAVKHIVDCFLNYPAELRIRNGGSIIVVSSLAAG